MRPAILGSIFIISMLFSMGSMAQENSEPYTARAFWQEVHNPRYQDILKKKQQGLRLSDAEMQWNADYEEYLERYFSRLPQEEKNKYEQFSTQWNDELNNTKESPDLNEMSRKNVVPPKKFMLNNGLYGFGYGLAADFIFEVPDEAAGTAIPFITSGISLLWPVLFKERYRDISYSTVMLARHGKFVGVLHGAALGLAIFGDHASPAEILTPMVVMSLGLGEVGFQLGKAKDWSEGRVATYQYYGLLAPAMAVTGLIIFHAERARPYGITVPIAGMAGYLLGNKVYNKNHFTRGDMLAASSFEIYSTGLGIGVVPMEHEEDLIAPLVTTIGGSVLNHVILKHKNLTAKQGWNVNYLSGAGAVLGLGVALLTGAESHNVYFILPAVGGFIGWFGALSAQTNKRNVNMGMKRKSKNSFSVHFMPENYFVNKHLPLASPGKLSPSAPLFDMSWRF